MRSGGPPAPAGRNVTGGFYGRVVELTPVQERAYRELIVQGAARPPPPEFAAGLRARLEEAVASIALPHPLWLSKGRLAEHAACEGLFAAALAAERPPFEHTLATAAGTLAHRAVYLDAASERSLDVRTIVEGAAARLIEADREFGAYWAVLDPLEQMEHLAAAAETLASFREAFPPFQRSWQPVGEQLLSATIGGRLTLSGRPDLILGRYAKLLVDFKSGTARPVHAEDMRFYALLATLVFGRAPYRVATVFLESMQWQAEDVTEDTLLHVARRTIEAARAAAELVGASRAPALTPGTHCGWCPRSHTCPASAARAS